MTDTTVHNFRKAPSAARPLPRGPHALTREQVVASQRERLLAAMADAAAAKGYARVTVADVLARAGISRATFYELFRDKDDCFRATFAWGAQLLAEVMASTASATTDPGASALDRLDRVLAVYLDVLASAPGIARTFLVESYAAGPEVVRQRQGSLDLFVDLVEEILGQSLGPLGDRTDQRFAVEAFVGAVSSMVTNLVAAERTSELPALREPIMGLVEQITGGRRLAVGPARESSRMTRGGSR